MRRSNRALVTVTLAVVMVAAAAGIAASKTMLDCLGSYEDAKALCNGSVLTDHMDTYDDVQRCLKRATSRLKICLANASDVPGGKFDTGRPRPKSGAFTPGILETGQFTPQGPAGAGSLPTAPTAPVRTAPPSIR